MLLWSIKNQFFYIEYIHVININLDLIIMFKCKVSHYAYYNCQYCWLCYVKKHAYLKIYWLFSTCNLFLKIIILLVYILYTLIIVNNFRIVAIDSIWIKECIDVKKNNYSQNIIFLKIKVFFRNLGSLKPQFEFYPCAVRSSW